jgi:succinoglycan biosynthesis protein ExoA
MDDLTPPVSVIMPVLNEEQHLAEAVAAITGQDYPGTFRSRWPSDPRPMPPTRSPGSLQADDPRILLVPNPTGRTPAGAQRRAGRHHTSGRGRVDGHALLPKDYISTAVEVLVRTGADNVGGVMAAEGVTDFERAVACAMRSPIGVGAASFHTGGQEGPALTVYLGAFRREALDRVGGYDEAYVRAQDWEMNHRIRESGGLIWFTPGMEVTYRPRSTVKALATQYLQYGRWRREIMRQHPQTVSLRYLAPPVAVMGLAAGAVLGAVGAIAGWKHAWLGAVPAAGVRIGGHCRRLAHQWGENPRR